jgi:hypothetical protein
MEPQWVACPLCGAHKQEIGSLPTRERVRSKVSNQILWSAISSATSAFDEHLGNEFDDILKSGDILGRTENEIQKGCSKLVQVLYSSLQITEGNLNERRLADQVFDQVSVQLRSLRNADLEVEHQDIPEGFFDQLKQSFTVGATDPLTHVAGSFLPGIGHAIGGAFAQFRKGQQQQKALEEYQRCVGELIEGLQESCGHAIWNALENLAEQGIELSAPFHVVKGRLSSLQALDSSVSEAYSSSAPNWSALLPAARKLSEALPDVSYAHYLLSEIAFKLQDYYGADEAAYTAHQLDAADPYSAITMLKARIGKMDWELAAQTGDYIFQRWREKPEILEIAAANLLDFPNYEPVGTLAGEIVNLIPESIIQRLTQIRLSALNGDSATLRASITKILLTEDPPLEHVLHTIIAAEELQRVIIQTEFRNVLTFPVDLEKVARLFFTPSDKVSFGELPHGKDAIGQGVGLHLNGEKVIFYVDATATGDGKNGVILTPTRVLWKGFWTDSYAIAFTKIEDLLYDDSGDLTLFLNEDAGDDDLINIDVLDGEFRDKLYRVLAIILTSRAYA